MLVVRGLAVSDATSWMASLTGAQPSQQDAVKGERSASPPGSSTGKDADKGPRQGSGQDSGQGPVRSRVHEDVVKPRPDLADPSAATPERPERGRDAHSTHGAPVADQEHESLCVPGAISSPADLNSQEAPVPGSEPAPFDPFADPDPTPAGRAAPEAAAPGPFDPFADPAPTAQAAAADPVSGDAFDPFADPHPVAAGPTQDPFDPFAEPDNHSREELAQTPAPVEDPDEGDEVAGSASANTVFDPFADPPEGGHVDTSAPTQEELAGVGDMEGNSPATSTTPAAVKAEEMPNPAEGRDVQDPWDIAGTLANARLLMLQTATGMSREEVVAHALHLLATAHRLH